MLTHPPHLSSLSSHSNTDHTSPPHTHTQSVTEEQLMHLFSTFAGLEYCDLKRERDTGESKVCVCWWMGVCMCMCMGVCMGECMGVCMGECMGVCMGV